VGLLGLGLVLEDGGGRLLAVGLIRGPQ